MDSAPEFFVGIDVQVKRPIAVAVFDSAGCMVDSFWTEPGCKIAVRQIVDRVGEVVGGADKAVYGIDAPRRALPAPRAFYWEAKRQGWRPRGPGDRGWGRHCEVVVQSCGLATPQWTAPASELPEWMIIGCCLFAGLSRRGLTAHEVFPSAAYKQLAGSREPVVTLDLSSFSESPKDMLDACTAAIVTREYCAGRGCAVGGDGLGEIILPRPLPDGTPGALLEWPEGKASERPGEDAAAVAS